MARGLHSSSMAIWIQALQSCVHEEGRRGRCLLDIPDYLFWSKKTFLFRISDFVWHLKLPSSFNIMEWSAYWVTLQLSIRPIGWCLLEQFITIIGYLKFMKTFVKIFNRTNCVFVCGSFLFCLNENANVIFFSFKYDGLFVLSIVVWHLHWVAYMVVKHGIESDLSRHNYSVIEGRSLSY